MLDTWVRSLGREDPLEEMVVKGSIGFRRRDPLEEMATHYSTLACRIPWTEEWDRLQSMESQRVGHNCATFSP